MKSSPLAIAFREVRHFKPEDWLHCEPLSLRAEAMDWTIPAHRHEGLHQFQYIASGQAEVVLDDMPHTVRAPAVLMVAPGCVHSFRFAPGSVGQQVSVSSLRLTRVLQDAPTLAALLPLTRLLQGSELDGETDRLAAIFASLADEFGRDAPGRSEVLQAHLVLLLTWFLRRAVSSAVVESRTALRDTLVQRYRALMEIHLRRHQSLGFYAEQLKVTPDHLSRTCRSATGSSALGLLHDRILLDARRLLAYTAAPVVDVARDLGFEDASYFSRFFSRRAGVSPLDYRAALQTGRETPP